MKKSTKIIAGLAAFSSALAFEAPVHSMEMATGNKIKTQKASKQAIKPKAVAPTTKASKVPAPTYKSLDKPNIKAQAFRVGARPVTIKAYEICTDIPSTGSSFAEKHSIPAITIDFHNGFGADSIDADQQTKSSHFILHALFMDQNNTVVQESNSDLLGYSGGGATLSMDNPSKGLTANVPIKYLVTIDPSEANDSYKMPRTTIEGPTTVEKLASGVMLEGEFTHPGCAPDNTNLFLNDVQYTDFVNFNRVNAWNLKPLPNLKQ